MSNDATHLRIPKRGIWGGYEIEKVGTGRRCYFWFGSGERGYLMGFTEAQATKLMRFLKANLKK